MAREHPFSRPIVAAELPSEGRQLHIEADAEERTALAGLLDVPAIASLAADLTLRPWRDGLSVEGTFDAVVTRVCVVSLEPFEAQMHEPVEARYGSPPAVTTGVAGSGAEGEPAGSHAVDLDAPEPLLDGKADLGHLVAEFLALGLDPYPHAPGVAFEPARDAAPDEAAHPFSVLAGLARRDRGEKT